MEDRNNQTIRAGDGGSGGDGINGGNGGNGGDGGSIVVSSHEVPINNLLQHLFGDNYKKYGLIGVAFIGFGALIYFFVVIIGNGGAVKMSVGGVNVVNGDKNYVNQINGENIVVTDSIYKDEQEKVWDEAYTPIQDFFTKLNNKNYETARQLLDKNLINDPHFSVQELQHFMSSVDGKLTIRDPRQDEGIKKDTEYVSNRGFYVYLRYLKNGKQINEGWRITSIKYNKEENLWKIGEMRCEDKRCENESYLAELNF